MAVPAIAPTPIAPTPAIAYPTLECVKNVVVGPKAMEFYSELEALDAARITGVIDWKRFNRLNDTLHGRWTTLPDGRKAMLWAFHAFAPPASNYRTPQPLVHLGFYNIDTRSLDNTEAPPALPKNKADWPW